VKITAFNYVVMIFDVSKYTHFICINTNKNYEQIFPQTCLNGAVHPNNSTTTTTYLTHELQRIVTGA
jgi:hypothetical protein